MRVHHCTYFKLEQYGGPNSVLINNNKKHIFGHKKKKINNLVMSILFNSIVFYIKVLNSLEKLFTENVLIVQLYMHRFYSCIY